MNQRTIDDRCPRCKGPKKPQFAVCWRCHTDDRLQSAYNSGYADGLRNVKGGEALDERRIRQLIQLVHPDRHGDSAASTDATQWLLQQRQRASGPR